MNFTIVVFGGDFYGHSFELDSAMMFWNYEAVTNKIAVCIQQKLQGSWYDQVVDLLAPIQVCRSPFLPNCQLSQNTNLFPGSVTLSISRQTVPFKRG